MDELYFLGQNLSQAFKSESDISELRLIIDIRFYETFSTLNKVASPKSACASLHFN